MTTTPRPTTADVLARHGWPAQETAGIPTSTKRFPDGVAFRIEIPSVEGPACVDAVLEEAERHDVPIRRLSQGSGVFLLTDKELDTVAETVERAGLEISLFARPNSGWGPSAAAAAPAGGVFAPSVRGHEQLVAAVDDIRRAAEHGIRSVLIADLGLLAVFGRMRAAGDLPPDMQAKVSVMLPIANAATAATLVELGANTLNLQTDLTLAQIASIRAAVDVPLDIYVEAPDNVGGFVRLPELPEIVRVAAPVYIKFGLRNAPDVYPSGTHLGALTEALSRERVRRARIGWEILGRAGVDRTTSKPRAAGLAVPVLPG